MGWLHVKVIVNNWSWNQPTCVIDYRSRGRLDEVILHVGSTINAPESGTFHRKPPKMRSVQAAEVSMIQRRRMDRIHHALMVQGAVATSPWKWIEICKLNFEARSRCVEYLLSQKATGPHISDTLVILIIYRPPAICREF